MIILKPNFACQKHINIHSMFNYFQRLHLVSPVSLPLTEILQRCIRSGSPCVALHAPPAVSGFVIDVFINSAVEARERSGADVCSCTPDYGVEWRGVGVVVVVRERGVFVCVGTLRGLQGGYSG